MSQDTTGATNMIPKSLHTVTVLVNVSLILADQYPTMKTVDLVSLAAEHLGYIEADDIYDLKGQAVKKLDKVRKPVALTLVKVA
jgi:hypothetical protein